MKTTYQVYEVMAVNRAHKCGPVCETLAAAMEVAHYSHWYIVEQVETERSFIRCVVARSGEEEKCPTPTSTDGIAKGGRGRNARLRREAARTQSASSLQTASK